MKKNKQFRGPVPRQPVDADNAVSRTEPGSAPKIGLRKGARPVVQKMKILKKPMSRGR